MMPPPLAAGHHESGHILCSVALGFTVCSVTLEEAPCEKCPTGKRRGQSEIDHPPIKTAEDVLAVLAMLLAGDIALRRFNPQMATRATRASDEASITELLDQHLPGDTWGQQEARRLAGDMAEEIIERNWDTLSRFAHMLVAWQTISASELPMALLVAGNGQPVNSL